MSVERQAPNFTAVDVTGKTVSLNSLHGKIVLMTWYYTHCTDECPLTMYRFEQNQNELIKQHEFGKNVVLIAMTFDPKRDTMPVIEKYGQHFNANLSGWYLLRTNLQKTDAILRAWGIQAKPSSNKDFIEHISKTVLIDQNGNIRGTYDTANLNTKHVLANINSLVTWMNWKL